MHPKFLLSAVLICALASCESVRTVYDENGRVVEERDGARERSLNDYFEDEFDSNFSEKKNKHGVPESTSKKVSSFQKDIDAARRGDKEFSTGTYNPGGSSSYAGKRFGDYSGEYSGNKRYEGVSANTTINQELRPAFMSEGKGISRAENVYSGHGSGDRYTGEGSHYDARERIYATQDSRYSTSDTSGYFESRKNKWGQPSIINKDDYYRRTIEETRGLLGRDD